MRWSIGAKIGASFAAVLALLIVMGATSYNSTSRFVESAKWVSHTHEVINRLDEVLGTMRDAETAERGFLITGHDSYLEPYKGARQVIAANIAELRELTKDNPSQQRRIAQLQPLLDAKFADIEATTGMRRARGITPAADLLRTDKGKRDMDAIRAALTEMKGAEIELLRGRSNEEEELAARTEQTIIGGSVIALLFVFLIGFLLNKNISPPLGVTSEALRAMAAGDLTVRLPVSRRRDEVGELMASFVEMSQSLRQIEQASDRIAGGDLTVQVHPRSGQDTLGKAFAAMGENLRHVTTETQGTVSVLSSAAQEIAATSTQVAASATETDAAVTETTRTISHLKQAALESTQRAQSVWDSSQIATRVAQSGKAATEDSIQVMNEIRRHMGSIAESIVRLSEQAQDIGKILVSVTDIAEQLNILALNALIVSANAGTEVSGFTVVANEVRSLAEQSKNATSEIRTILNDIRTATTEAIKVTEEGSQAVDDGVKKSLQAGESVTRLALSITKAASEAREIVASCHQQVESMDQIATAMENIKVASAQNVSGTRETKSAATNLLQLGRSLQDLVAHYTV